VIARLCTDRLYRLGSGAGLCAPYARRRDAARYCRGSGRHDGQGECPRWIRLAAAGRHCDPAPATGLIVRAIPLDENVIRLLTTDSYRALRDLEESTAWQSSGSLGVQAGGALPRGTCRFTDCSLMRGSVQWSS
jgi:hypothetical protein